MCFFQGKDFEKTTITNLQIKVENEEPLVICKDKLMESGGKLPPLDLVNITMKVIDMNDPPEFEKNPANVYQKEEDEPGKVLFTPVVKDVDSEVSSIRLVSTYCVPAEELPHCE